MQRCNSYALLDTAGCYECVIFKCCTQFNRFYGIYLKCTIGVAVCCYCLLLRGLSGSKLVKMDIKFTGSCTEMSRKYCFPPCPTTTHINVNPHWKSCTIWTTPRLFPLARTTGVITRWHAQGGSHYYQRVACEPQITCEGRSAASTLNSSLSFRCSPEMWWYKFVVLSGWYSIYRTFLSWNKPNWLFHIKTTSIHTAGHCFLFGDILVQSHENLVHI